MPGRLICRVIWLGQRPYREAWDIQEKLAIERGADHIPDTLLLVEHPPTYTLGSSGHDEHILFSPEELQARGIAIYRVNRGGDVTYHGPGQLVGYPILKLSATGEGSRLKTDVVAYIRQIEQMLIAALAVYGIAAWPYPGYTGVWVGEPAAPAKIAAIGVKVTVHRVTLHGFALNVNTDLDYFTGIIPCGISDKPVTSMQAVLGKDLDFGQVAGHVTGAFGAIFNREMVPARLPISSPDPRSH